MLRSLLVFTLLLGACSSSSGAIQAQNPALADDFREAPVFTAVVTDDAAAFILPIPERSEWVWSAPETPVNAPEYRWRVAVANEGDDYEFGFWKFKHSRLTPTRGSLDELIEAGQESLWRANADGGSSVVFSAGVRVVPLALGRVLISVEGAENVARLFSSRPRTVDTVIETPGEPEVERTIVIEYRSDG